MTDPFQNLVKLTDGLVTKLISILDHNHDFSIYTSVLVIYM